MPNHVTNYLRLEGESSRVLELLDAVQADEYGLGSIDFNKIIPMPPSLNITSGSDTHKGLNLYRDFIEVYLLGQNRESVDLLDIPEASEAAFLRSRTDISPQIWELGKAAFQNQLQYGSATWYEWCNQHWDTKWNGYGFDELGPNDPATGIRMLTAWSAPHPVILMLSHMFPDVTIEHTWADEDIGFNCGRHTYQNGELIEAYYPEDRRESVEFAADVLGCSPADFGLILNEDETEYVYEEELSANYEEGMEL